MIIGLMTLCTGEIQTPHMDIKRRRRIYQRVFEISMFHVISTTTIKVTGAAVLSGGQGYTPRDHQQIDISLRHTSPFGILPVGPGTIMTDQTIDIIRIGKIERGVLPAITGMATGTTWPIGFETDTEIIQGVFLAEGNRLVMTVNALRFSDPGPVF